MRYIINCLDPNNISLGSTVTQGTFWDETIEEAKRLQSGYTVVSIEDAETGRVFTGRELEKLLAS